MYFALVFLAVFVFMGSLLLIKYAQVELPNSYEMAQAPDMSIKEDVGAKGWIKKVAQFKASSEVLPVTFMHIEINDNYPKQTQSKPKEHFEIIVPRCNEYSLFCMRRVAKSLDIELSVAKVGDSHSIFITTPNAAAANSFVTALKQYNIHSKIKEVK